MMDSSRPYYLYLGCSVLAREIYREMATVDSLIDLHLLPAGFHEQPQTLKDMLQEEINRVEAGTELRRRSEQHHQEYRAILIGYGLCNQAVAGLSSRLFRLVLPRAHDCITLLLGSKERYQQEFDAHPDNFWFSPGWIERMLPPGPERDRFLKQEYQRRYDAENAAYLLEMESEWQQKYQSGTLISWGFPNQDEYRRHAKTSAAHLGWEYREVSGDPRLLRDLLAGNWDTERFLVTEPGQIVAPSYDDRIILAE